MLKIYKDGNSFYLITDIKTSTEFIDEMTKMLVNISERFSEDIEYQIEHILPMCYTILLRLDKYVTKEKQGCYQAVGAMTPYSNLIYETDANRDL